MTTLTISVADDLYVRATKRASEEKTTVPAVVNELLSEWTQQVQHDSLVQEKHRAHFQTFLDSLAARPLKTGPSVGPLNREELYERGVSRH